MGRIFNGIFLVTFLWAGRLGIGISGGGEYSNDFDYAHYKTLTSSFYGAEFHLQTEALPSLYLEPLVLYFNDRFSKEKVLGIGMRINVAPRLGRFFLGPFFGIAGNILFYNHNMDLDYAIVNSQLKEFFEGSSPRTTGFGFTGLSIYLGKTVSLDCQYRYLISNYGLGVEMAWAGLTYYINW